MINDQVLTRDRLEFYVSQIPKMECMCEKLLELYVKSPLREDGSYITKDLLSLYVRLLEVHERVMTLLTQMVERSSSHELLSDDEVFVVQRYSAMNERQKVIFLNMLESRFPL